MVSEYMVDLCFIRPETEGSQPFPELDALMISLFSSSATFHIDRKKQDGLDIAVAQINGLSLWSSEQEVIEHLEANMPSESLEWLSGYRIQVIAKEDAGTCLVKKGE